MQIHFQRRCKFLRLSWCRAMGFATEWRLGLSVTPDALQDLFFFAMAWKKCCDICRILRISGLCKDYIKKTKSITDGRDSYHQWLSHWDIRAILYYVRRAMDYTIRQNGASTVILPAGWTLLASGSTVDQINQTLKLTCRNTEGRTQSITVTFLPSISSGQPPSNRPTKIPDLLN